MQKLISQLTITDIGMKILGESNTGVTLSNKDGLIEAEIQ